MQYAYLQLGQDEMARALVAQSAELEGKKTIGGVGPVVGMARAAVPARYMLERQDWAGASQLQPKSLPFPAANAITHFARALGYARLGDAAAAQADIDKIAALREAHLKANQPYWAEQVEVQLLAARAWAQRAQGLKDEALKLMRAAADLEDSSEKHVAMENRLYPMRELLADMLLEGGDATAALKEYEASMKNTPNRLRGWYGAAKAAGVVGDGAKTVEYTRRLAELTRNGDASRREVSEARLVVAQR
jgi:tetratricopeptide (TPR) repeat protein